MSLSMQLDDSDASVGHHSYLFLMRVDDIFKVSTVYVHPKLPRRDSKVSMDIKDLEVCCAHGGGVCVRRHMRHAACVCGVVWFGMPVWSVAVMGWRSAVCVTWAVQTHEGFAAIRTDLFALAANTSYTRSSANVTVSNGVDAQSR